ncbi:MAG: hypothetical protein HKO59_08220 [Phycisphaerales bacterium]|nr:hypothetical protein [Phycisphaerales bacterium]
MRVRNPIARRLAFTALAQLLAIVTDERDDAVAEAAASRGSSPPSSPR